MPLLEMKTTAVNWFSSDIQFNQLYPASIQSLAQRHWTPLIVAKKAADFLAAENNAKILDIGSGVGKFCLAAAHYKPKAFFYGIEQRKRLVTHAATAKELLGVDNVSFMNGNFTQIDFRNYDHFYFYNAFYENITGTDKIDNSIDYSLQLYNYYNRLCSFHSLDDEMPRGYHIVGSEMNELLKYWIKI
jgi:ubiquinone/menaquinone biosynthesis C-methylase UbiE